MSEKTQLVEALRGECSDVATRITAYHVLGERTLTLSSSVVFAAVAIAVTNGHRYALLPLPVALFTIATYVMYLNTEVVALGGYKAALESKLNALLESPAIVWESRIAHDRHASVPTIAVRVLFGVLLAATSAIAIREAALSSLPGHWGHDSWGWILAATIASVIVGAACLVVSFVSESRTHRRVSAMAVELLAPSRSENRRRRGLRS